MCYRWLGVDHIFLTDNNSSSGEEARERLAAAFPSSFLSLHSEMEPRAQLKVYAWCAEEHRASYNWLAFLDVDEFIVLRGRYDYCTKFWLHIDTIMPQNLVQSATMPFCTGSQYP